MGSQEMWLAAGGAVALLLLVAVLALGSGVRRSARRHAALAARVSALEAAVAAGPDAEPGGARVDPVAHEPGEPHEPREPASYVITGIDAGAAQPPVQGRVEAPLFADIVARESVIRAAGLAAGVRRALAPQTRNRIRFEMRREVKRSRRQRRADLKAALRDLQARERARMAGEGDAA